MPQTSSNNKTKVDQSHPEYRHESRQLKLTQDQLDAYTQKLLTQEAAAADAETALGLEDDMRERGETLRSHIQSPYFGCMVIQIGGREERVYIGRESWFDGKGGKVLSWTSPAGELYASTASSGQMNRRKGEVMLRRSIEILPNQFELTAIHDTYVRPGSRADHRLIDAEEPVEREESTESIRTPEASLEDQARNRHDLLERALSAQGGSEARRDVIATLQPEQDMLIRLPARGTVIQGPAGSGKTALLTHRVAWLCATDSQSGQPTDPDSVTLVVPTPGLARSVSLSCQALNLPVRAETGSALEGSIQRGVRIYTDGDLVQRLAGTRALMIDRVGWLLHAARITLEEKRHAWARAKVLGDWRLHECIRRMLIRRAADNFRNSKPLQITQLDIQISGEWVSDQIMTLSGIDSPSPLGDSPTPVRVMRETMLLISRELTRLGLDQGVSMQEAEKAVNRTWRWSTPMHEVKKIEHDASELANEVEVVMGPSRATLLRGPDHRSRAPLPRQGWIDHLDLGLLLAFQELGTQTSFQQSSRLSELGEMQHLLIDESQDLSSLLLHGMARRWKRMTLVGDLSQGISGHRGISSWKQASEAIAAAWKIPADQIHDLTRGQSSSAAGVTYGELTRCYRSTRQITEAAWPVAAPWCRTSPAQAFEREGPAIIARVARTGDETWKALAEICAGMLEVHPRVVIVCRSEMLADETAKQLQNRNINARAVTASAGARAQGQQTAMAQGHQQLIQDLAADVSGRSSSNALSRGAIVMDVLSAKGLEAAACIVMGADPTSFDPSIEHDARLLYVAMTRGMHQLALVARDELHPALKHLQQDQTEREITPA